MPAPTITTVYFATNRKKSGTGYGDGIVHNDPLNIAYAVASVKGINLTKENSGSIDKISNLSFGEFNPIVRNQIANGGKNLLIFIHGFANAFNDAIKRAAFNREWFADSGAAHADTTVVAFTWPSKGEVFAAPPHIPTEDYMSDQARAGQSGFHLAHFFKSIEGIIADFRKATPKGRVFLLAHSMGNYALQAGVQAYFGMGGTDEPIFDEAILAAGDERWDSFEQANGWRLANLRRMTKRVTLYYSEKDVAMYLALALNFLQRLGFDGPRAKGDVDVYPKNKFRLVEVTKVKDYSMFSPPDASHQYYRRSKIVRGDIASVMANTAAPGGGIIKLSS